ncbi:hypothetical protein CORC01_12487 [Colletotrichum orchidophilum]|uniref:Mid2 domain-containing protein n=1 Tax=Colletotrichum orchidophilum TaxID=1209926 RepID=A0A1G4ASX8_9PEZI|nr:uncharacterized protein CORC01_12487 [Colletotrichum orchidophilum]OHE92193.1 hypothetical protein CORC01_12487 [Colletotrichum orchidophilum]
MRLGSAGLAVLLWSSFTTLTTAFPFADNVNPTPVLRPRQAGTGSTPTSTTSAVASETTAPAETSAAAEPTTTVTVTTTVGGGGAGGTVTSTTVFLRTIITTVVVTSTTFQTTTITSNDVATATVTHYVTSTVLAKRSLNFLPAPDAPFDAPAAQITPAVDPRDIRRYGVIEKRALVTVVVTVSGSAAADTTVLSTQTSTVVVTTTSNTVFTSMITSTLFNNAKTTITVESTLTVTSTSINTAAPTTVESGPTTGNLGTATATATGGAQSTGSSSSGGGLSTGAQAGIGVGVGVVGLAALIAIGYWLYKRRKANRPSRADLDDMRAYDPNGPSPLGGSAGMSEAGYGGAAALGAGAGTQRRQPVHKHQLSPPSQSVSPVSNSTVSPTGGAQELGGTRILPAEMGGDEVVEMGESQPRPQPQQPPQQQQSRPAPGMTYNSGPVPDVYEMPTERYR